LVLRARPGRRDDIVALFERLRVLERASEVDGFRDGQLHVAADEPDELLVTASWEDAAAYGRWLESPVREAMRPELEVLLAAEPTPRVYEVVRALP
jgi:quinol monooxygenase YgiN